jgi:hypothetical protein
MICLLYSDTEDKNAKNLQSVIIERFASDIPTLRTDLLNANNLSS